jgi:hypothetical protein
MVRERLAAQSRKETLAGSEVFQGSWFELRHLTAALGIGGASLGWISNGAGCQTMSPNSWGQAMYFLELPSLSTREVGNSEPLLFRMDVFERAASAIMVQLLLALRTWRISVTSMLIVRPDTATVLRQSDRLAPWVILRTSWPIPRRR